MTSPVAGKSWRGWQNRDTSTSVSHQSQTLFSVSFQILIWTTRLIVRELCWTWNSNLDDEVIVRQLCWRREILIVESSYSLLVFWNAPNPYRVWQTVLWSSIATSEIIWLTCYLFWVISVTLHPLIMCVGRSTLIFVDILLFWYLWFIEEVSWNTHEQ